VHLGLTIQTLEGENWAGEEYKLREALIVVNRLKSDLPWEKISLLRVPGPSEGLTAKSSQDKIF
jgi:hypothetical protein